MPGWGRVSPHHRPTTPRVQRSLAVTLAVTLATDSTSGRRSLRGAAANPCPTTTAHPPAPEGPPQTPALRPVLHTSVLRPPVPLPQGLPRPRCRALPVGSMSSHHPSGSCGERGPTGTLVQPSTAQHLGCGASPGALRRPGPTTAPAPLPGRGEKGRARPDAQGLRCPRQANHMSREPAPG